MGGAPMYIYKFFGYFFGLLGLAMLYGYLTKVVKAIKNKEQYDDFITYISKQIILEMKDKGVGVFIALAGLYGLFFLINQAIYALF